ncbi:aKG-HExxH-type peptide beta-hydroxylase [Umezawaea sp. NPDC059074]|uniref:aKG-HExxH-type peptide beta-hydroxylase n=1 Tax=Umezawaea sp. NPDC059074 TaxID=3346716 RepID=UPI0036A19347
MTSDDGPAVELNTHFLPRHVFDEICAGSMSPAGMVYLRASQLSLRKLRLRVFAESVTRVTGQLAPFAGISAAWDLLAEAERRAPAAVEDVLMYPTVGVWLVRALRQVLGIAPDTTPLFVEVGGFHALAAAAAIRSGVDFTIPVPVVHGAVTLPSVGVVRVPTGIPVGYVDLWHASGKIGIAVLGANREVPLESLRRHRSSVRGRTVDLVFDDLDIYREFECPRRATPLSEREYDEWCKFMDEAWDVLTAHHSESAVELSEGLSTVVPLGAEQRVFAASSTAAFGSIAMSPKQSAVTFAEALVHETQHSKLNALLDLVVLCEDDGVGRFYAPWLDYPRTITALLHGIFAFCSVVEFSHVQCGLAPAAERRYAHFTTAYRRVQVGLVVDTLSRVPELTPLGREFVASVSVRLAVCPSPADLPADVADTIRWMTTVHSVVWRLRHVRSDDDLVDALADAWVRGASAPRLTGVDVVEASPETGRTALEVLLRAQALEPDHVARLGSVDAAEAAFLGGDLRRAASLFSTRVGSAPGDVEAWAGLAIATDSAALRRRPEVVRAVHDAVALRTGRAPEPGELAAWLDPAAS